MRARLLVAVLALSGGCISNCSSTSGSSCVETLDCVDSSEPGLVCVALDTDDPFGDGICAPAVPLPSEACSFSDDCVGAGWPIDAECDIDLGSCRCTTIETDVECDSGSFDPVTCGCDDE